MSSASPYLDLLEKLYEKHSETSDDIREIRVIVAKQEQQLAEHIRRTELAEENIALIRNDIKPLQRHIDYINGGLKLIGLIATCVGIIAGIVKTFF